MTSSHLQYARSTLFVILLAVVAALGVGTAAPASAAPYCGIVWGSLAKSGPGRGGVWPGPEGILAVRTGQHPCYNRLVVDLSFTSADYNVEYVPTVLYDPTGDGVPLAGGARLQIVVSGFPVGWEEQGHALPMPSVAGYRTFRQVAFAGSFEHITTIGLGVRARLPFRVFPLAGPGSGSRLVVDVAHRW